MSLAAGMMLQLLRKHLDAKGKQAKLKSQMDDGRKHVQLILKNLIEAD